MPRLLRLSAILLLISAAASAGSDPARRPLQIYYVDVEGGAATLIVTPAGEAVLIDAGWPGFEDRDARRIQAALKQAGITAIDHLIMTHYHVDHYGGIPALARLVPVRRFYDRGPLLPEIREYQDNPQMYRDYHVAARQKSVALKPGDTIRLKNASGAPRLTLRCLAAGGATIQPDQQLPNAECTTNRPMDEDKSDNARSVVVKLSYGDFDFLDAGDLTWNIESRLVCPNNLIGEVDLYQVTHHGANTSNNPVLLRSVKPTVAIMNNGARKGGHPDVIKALRETASIKDIWQVHRNVATTSEQNAPADFIANPEAEPDAAQMIVVAVDAARRVFTVTNQRNGMSRSYPFR
jgi:beta-lactamase superfamily II metal-dependent hydrolase